MLNMNRMESFLSSPPAWIRFTTPIVATLFGALLLVGGVSMGAWQTISLGTLFVVLGTISIWRVR